MSGVYAWGTFMSGMTASASNLARLSCGRNKTRRTDLHGADLTNAKFTKCMWDGIILSSAVISNTSMDEGTFGKLSMPPPPKAPATASKLYVGSNDSRTVSAAAGSHKVKQETR